ncbi:MOSC domain-containing protein [Planktotalea arctica]|uniref:MOSC domain-containing protein n=1 Tax=Planktotalea arctica TaxID=1481893 RepID=UPI00321AC98D
MTQVTSLWRHPIKSHGREAVQSTTLIAGHTMPGDRVWAVAHDASSADGSAWVSCGNFSRVSKAPALMAMTATLNDVTGMVTLNHPKLAEFTFNPDGDIAPFLDWVRPIMPSDRAQSARLVRVPDRGMTDSDFPSVTICNMSSHRAVQQKIGFGLSIHRWRGNIWLDGLAPWEEFDWMDRDIRIGDAILRPMERTDRCAATTTNPETGLRDADILSVLDSYGHRDFSVRAEVIQGGHIEIDNKAELI